MSDRSLNPVRVVRATGYRAEAMRRKIRQRLRFNLREVDRIFMLSVDEIAVLLPYLEQDRAGNVAESLQKAVLSESLYNDIALKVSVACSRPGMTPETLWAAAYSGSRMLRDSQTQTVCLAG